MIFWIVDYSTITQAKVVLNTTIRTTAISIINYNIEHLETRMAQPTTYKTRKDSRLNMFYKKVNNKVEIQKTDRLIPQKRQARHSHTNNSFQIPSCKTEYRKESGTDWSKLPENIINSTSLDSFKFSIPKLQY